MNSLQPLVIIAAVVALVGGFFLFQKTDGIPFELVNNHIYVPVKVNGSAAKSFLLDTGASSSVLDTATADEVGIEMYGDAQSQGAGSGGFEVKFADDVAFSLPGLKFSPRTVAAISLDVLTAVEGRTVDGILGFDVINEYVVDIDFEHQRVNFTDSYTVSEAQTVIPFMWWNNIPIINIDLALPDGSTISGDFIVDIGASATIGVTSPFAQQHGLADAIHTIAPPPVQELGGESRFLVGRMPGVWLGDFQFENTVFGISLNTEGVFASPEIAGLVGGELLRRFNVIFDYANQLIVLEPRPDWNAPTEVDMSGLFLGLDGDAFVIQTVMEGSPTSNAGVLPQDRIVAINGKPSSKFMIDEVRDLLMEEGRSVTLTLDRGGERINVTFTLRRLI